MQTEKEMQTYRRGQVVRVRAYGGEILTRRVWEDAHRGVLLCSEEGYQRFVAGAGEPLWSGFSKEDVIYPAAQAGCPRDAVATEAQVVADEPDVEAAE